jgi:UDP-N-acetylglucosamine:LPS N-acetylglucosamine transferase
VASGGGHWVQLLRLAPALEGQEVTYVTVARGYLDDVRPQRGHVINDATRWNKFGLVRMALRILWILVRTRPDVVISTGAAPGYFALRMGRWFGARTIWVDSIANVERMSMAGQQVRKYADLWLTQWEHLAEEDGPSFAGAVL